MPPRRVRRRSAQGGKTGLAVFSAAAALLLMAGLYLWWLGGSTPPPVPEIGGPFTLKEGDGKVVTDRDFRGRFLLIYFGYTSCPDICPTTLTAVADAQRLLGSRAAKLQPIFITVDPERDTPAVTRAYARNFSPDIIGLSGTAAQIQAVETEYRVSVAMPPAHSGAMAYAVDHTAVLFLVAPDGRYLAPLPATATAAEIADRLARYLS